MPLPVEVLQARLSGQTWTSHNIRLTAEITTMPGQADFLQTNPRLLAILRVLQLLYAGRLSGLRIADLGCLEGGFATALAQRGARVLGIEARRLNLEKAQLLKDHFELDTLDLVLGDVKDFTRSACGTFDVVLALGILYHLDRPHTWLRQVAEATSRLLIVDTHFAPSEADGLGAVDPRLSLGPIVQTDGSGRAYAGRWFHEYDENVDPEPQIWASYSNHRSFWLTKESLLLALYDAGFDLVFEQHDHTASEFRHFAETFPRIMLVAARNERRSG